MKEFRFRHEDITMGVEIPVTVCETQKEMVAELVMQKECFEFATERMNEVEEKRINGYYNFTDGTLNEYTYGYAMKEAISGTDEETMYIIYKDGSEYWNGAGETKGKFKRGGIKRAMISTSWGYTVFGDFAISDMGDVTIEESEIEEYGVYAGQYDVKEQDEQEVQETVEQTTEVEIKTEEMVETEEYGSGFEYYSVKVAYETMKDKTYSIVFMNYLEALKVAKHFTKVLDGEKAIVIAVNFVIRNDRQPESERDKRVLEAETAEIEMRCVPYNYLGLKGYVSIEDKQIVNEDIA